jgi:hypothetical protein
LGPALNTKSSVVRWSGGIGIALVTLTLSGCATTGFPTGSGTATITWRSVGGVNGANETRPQPYSGSIAGVPVSGTLVPLTPHFIPNPGGGGSLPSTLTFARWTGSFEGKRFVLTASAKTSGLLKGLLNNASEFTVDIDGTFGTEHVTGTASSSETRPNILFFMGAVGRHHVAGTVRPIQHGASNKATAKFTVTG